MHECHVTINAPENRAEMEEFGKSHGWKTSYIIGDPLLGKQGFFYFTTHHVDYDAIFTKMEKLAALLGDKVIREKIEKIVYDTKTSMIMPAHL